MSLSPEQAKKLWNEMYEGNKVKLGIFHAADLYLGSLSLPEKIKEAKKEFPLRLAEDTIAMLEREIRIHKDEQQLCAYTKDIIITLKWALKWFGDVYV